jgi:phosphoglycerol transferase MdoB-like AlkP superfamily enzyme
MSSRVAFLVRYLLFWTALFTAARMLFLVYERAHAGSLGAGLVLAILLHGLRMDLATAAYLTVLPALLLAISAVIAGRLLARVLAGYTMFVLLLVSLLTVSDLGLFDAWGIRLDGRPLQYLRTPREAFASAQSSPLVLLLVLLVLFLALGVWAWRTFVAPVPGSRGERGGPVAAVAMLVLGAALIVPIRGGVQWTPLNESSVYFSTDDFANQAALNAGWNFFHSVTTSGALAHVNPYDGISAADAKAVVDSLVRASDAEATPLLRVRHPNVILIIWESFTAKVVQRLGGLAGVTPNFDALSHEGVLFDHVYASGDRSAKGLVAILSGYPAQPRVQIMNTPAKAARLPMLAKHLGAAGYETAFYYGGELAFANIKSYIIAGGFHTIVGESAFDPKDRNSKWGAHDGVVLQRLLRDISSERRPFFDALFTLSSHEPFEVPMAPVFRGTDEQSKFLNAMAYADRSVGAFVRAAQRQPWWDSTLVVIVADHGHPLPRLSSRAGETASLDYHIPMLWLGGALAVRDTVITRVGSQTDLAPTLLGELGLPHAAFGWGKNLLANDAMDYAYFSYHDGFGYVDANGRLVYDAIGKRVIQRAGSAGPPELRSGRAYLRSTYQQYLDW